MRRLLTLLLSLLACNGFAQDHRRLAGYVQLPGEPLNSYFLEIDIKGTVVTGYSITNYKTGNRLKASVVGKLSPASELYIEETGSLDGPESRRMAYCYFSAYLKLSVFNGKQRWAGPFDSRQVDGTSCGSGYMTIMENAPPLDEPSKVETAPRGMRVQEDSPRPAPTKAAVPVVPPPPKTDTVKAAPPVIPKPRSVVVVPPRVEPPKPGAGAPVDTNDCLRTIDWDSETFSFDVWDGWAIDGDVISLSIGGKMLLDRVKLSETKQRFNVPLAKGVNIITIFFYEEGFDAPNTPNMTIYDGDKAQILNISGKNGETARICINRTR
jgi:hypothetical protein